jgi:hypothetical protein
VGIAKAYGRYEPRRGIEYFIEEHEGNKRQFGVPNFNEWIIK